MNVTAVNSFNNTVITMPKIGQNQNDTNLKVANKELQSDVFQKEVSFGSLQQGMQLYKRVKLKVMLANLGSMKHYKRAVDILEGSVQEGMENSKVYEIMEQLQRAQSEAAEFDPKNI